MLFVQALLTALLSGVFSGAIIFAFNERKERRDKLLDKAEAAVEAYLEWGRAVSEFPYQHFKLFESADGRRDVAVDLNAEWDRILALQHKAMMLVSVYLNGKVAVITEVSQTFRPFIDMREEMMMLALNGGYITPPMGDMITRSSARIRAITNKGAQTLLVDLRKLAHAPYLVRLPMPWKRKPGSAVTPPPTGPAD